MPIRSAKDINAVKQNNNRIPQPRQPPQMSDHRTSSANNNNYNLRNNYSNNLNNNNNCGFPRIQPQIYNNNNNSNKMQLDYHHLMQDI